MLKCYTIPIRVIIGTAEVLCRQEENGELGTNNHLSAVVKRDPEVPGKVTADNGFSTKHTDDCRIDSHISKLCNFYPAQVGGSKDTRYLIGEGKPQIAVWRFAIGHQTFGDNQIAIKAGIKERLNRLSALVEDNGDGNVGEMRAGKGLFLTHNHSRFAYFYWSFTNL